MNSLRKWGSRFLIAVDVLLYASIGIFAGALLAALLSPLSTM